MSKNFVLPGSGRGARLGFSWVKNFVEVSSLTKITKFLPHENYTLYGIAGNFRRIRIVEHHMKIKTTKMSLHNRFYVTMLSCTNI